jgi:hypothetical protein
MRPCCGYNLTHLCGSEYARRSGCTASRSAQHLRYLWLSCALHPGLILSPLIEPLALNSVPSAQFSFCFPSTVLLFCAFTKLRSLLFTLPQYIIHHSFIHLHCFTPHHAFDHRPLNYSFRFYQRPFGSSRCLCRLTQACWRKRVRGQPQGSQHLHRCNSIHCRAACRS